ncbi:MAG: hypothetical protein GDA54_00460 [Alphaproteobacteria bacterium GM7ARS4]|nr:hypothetical protein [Alphaproteobacteria bacterium GM7ARS4]
MSITIIPCVMPITAKTSHLPVDFYGVSEQHHNIRLLSNHSALAHSPQQPSGPFGKLGKRKVYRLVHDGRSVEKANILDKKTSRMGIQDAFQRAMQKTFQDLINSFDTHKRFSSLRHDDIETINQEFGRLLSVSKKNITERITTHLQGHPVSSAATSAQAPLTGKDLRHAIDAYHLAINQTLHKAEELTQNVSGGGLSTSSPSSEATNRTQTSDATTSDASQKSGPPGSTPKPKQRARHLTAPPIPPKNLADYEELHAPSSPQNIPKHHTIATHRQQTALQEDERSLPPTPTHIRRHSEPAPALPPKRKPSDYQNTAARQPHATTIAEDTSLPHIPPKTRRPQQASEPIVPPVPPRHDYQPLDPSTRNKENPYQKLVRQQETEATPPSHESNPLGLRETRRHTELPLPPQQAHTPSPTTTPSTTSPSSPTPPSPTQTHDDNLHDYEDIDKTPSPKPKHR